MACWRRSRLLVRVLGMTSSTVTNVTKDHGSSALVKMNNWVWAVRSYKSNHMSHHSMAEYGILNWKKGQW